MTLRTIMAFVAGLALLGCAAAVDEEHTSEAAGISGPQAWGSADNVMHYKHIYVARQPDEAGFVAARANGVKVVINTRLPDEVDWDERAAVESEGMIYYNVPISNSGDSLDNATMHRITRIVEQHHDDQILLHCRSGNRVSAWLATHMVEDHQMDRADAIDLAHKMGLTKAALEKRVNTYLDEVATKQ